MSLIFIAFDIFLILILKKENGIAMNIFLGFLIYGTTLILITFLGVKFSGKIEKVVWMPILIFIYIQKYINAPFITIIFFIITFFFPIVFLIYINSEIIPISNIEAWLYLIGILVCTLFAYKSDKVLKWSIRYTKATKVVNKFEKYMTTNYTRIFVYILLIVIYVWYNTLYFINTNKVSNELSVIKEVLVTFVSIDTLIQIIINRKKQV